MAKKRAKKRPSMRPAAPELVMLAPTDPLADTVELRATSSEIGGSVLVSPAPQGPDTLAPVAGEVGATTPAEPPPSPGVVDAEPQDDVMAIAFFASGGAVEANLREEARRLDELEREERPPPPSPQQLARRRRLQGAVGFIVAATAAMFVLALGLRASPGAPGPQPALAAARPVALAEPVKVPVAAEPVATVEAVAPPPEAVAPTRAHDVEAAPSLDPAAAKALTKSALSSLERGKYADAITHAKAAIAADPSDANAYLYWGTALMETGKRADAKTVFAACVEAATRGPKHECRAFR